MSDVLFSNIVVPISEAKEGQIAVDAFVLITEICHNLNVKIKQEIWKEERIISCQPTLHSLLST